MKQIVINWLFVFILPLVLGAALRFACRKRKKAWLLTLAAAVLAAAACAVACAPPVSGNEAYGIRTVQAALFAAASCLTGILTRKKGS